MTGGEELVMGGNQVWNKPSKLVGGAKAQLRVGGQ